MHITTISLKFLLQLGMMNLICLMYLIRFLIYKIILNTSSKKINPPIQIYVHKIKNKIAFKIKTGYTLELLTE